MCEICGCGTDHHAHHHHDSDLITIEQDILAENNKFAEQNRKYFLEKNITTLNLMSSPGSGKTTLLVKTIAALKATHDIAIIEGDQQTDVDAKRIAAEQVPVLQINTGRGCHLDAHQINHALSDLSPNNNSFLLIENVGNLVCPALFDLGEKDKIVILSVTEGSDKPLKYPFMFAEATLMMINKMDLLPYVDFDVKQCIAYAKKINPNIQVLQVSATKDNGMEEWLAWLKNCKIVNEKSTHTNRD